MHIAQNAPKDYSKIFDSVLRSTEAGLTDQYLWTKDMYNTAVITKEGLGKFYYLDIPICALNFSFREAMLCVWALINPILELGEIKCQ